MNNLKYLLCFSIFSNALLAVEPAYQPKPEYGSIAQQVVANLPKNHLSQHKFDDVFSARAWTNFLNSVDYDRTLLTQQDIAKLESMRLKIDDDLKSGSVQFGYDLMSLIKSRMNERVAFIEEALKKPFDFTLNDSYLWKRKDAVRPATEVEQKDMWYKSLKNEFLALKLTKELDEKEDLENKEKDSVEKEEAKTSAEDEDLREPVDVIIKKRWKSLLSIYDEMDTETVLQRYLSAISTVYDPHTDYMAPMTLEEFEMDMSLTLYGIGAILRYDDGMIKVAEIMPGGPAGRDERDIKLIEGDKIIGVGQDKGPIEDVRHKSLSRSIRKIRGPKGTRVVLKVIPAADKAGATTRLVDLVRDEIKLETQAVTGTVYKLAMPDSSVRKLGYIKIPAFYASIDNGKTNRSMTHDLIKNLCDLNTERVDGLIIDLRYNGGGSLPEAINMTSLFVQGPVVQVRDATRVQAISTNRISESAAFRKPLVILVNRASASASEIVAGALQDYGRAIIIGDSQTHGKGTVQRVMPLKKESFGSQKITTAGFYRITGSSTQLKGVVPDIVIPSFLDSLEIGENVLPWAIPWSTVSPAYYMKVSDTSSYVAKLKQSTAKRLEKNQTYQKSLKLFSHLKKINDETNITLNEEKRKSSMIEERQLRKFEDDYTKRQNSKKELINTNDTVLIESFQILSDYIDLRGGPDVPVNINGDLGHRIFQLFGN